MMHNHLNLPILAYGSLRGEGISEHTKARVKEMCTYITRGVLIGAGDHYPCADITHNMNHVAAGEALLLEGDPVRALADVDRYEGIAEGYYERHIIFAIKEDMPNLFVPMWVYTRGDRLR